MNTNTDILGVTAFFSAIIHCVLILGVTFKAPDIKSVDNIDNTLDVVLVNTSNNEAPEDADLLSQNNNQGGGEDSQGGSTPLPWKAVTPAATQTIKREASSVETTITNDEKIMLSDASEVKIQTVEETETVIKTQSAKKEAPDKITTKTQRQLEKERLIAKLAQQWEDYQKRPKREFLSPATKKHGAAEYLESWRKKVERIGNTNYPDKAKTEGLHGTLIIDVAINIDGTINKIDMRKPSKYKLLNDAAIRFIRLAAPFDPFPESISKETDIVHITRAYHFLDNNRLTSTSASNIANTN